MLLLTSVPYYHYYQAGSLVLVFQFTPMVFTHYYVLYKFHFISELPFFGAFSVPLPLKMLAHTFLGNIYVD